MSDKLQDYSIENATHLLSCKHCIGTRCSYYDMWCILLTMTKHGKCKVIVFGERNWKHKDHIKKIRYVWPNQLTKISKV